MLNLSGLLDSSIISIIHEAVSTKFKDSSIFITPESLILYEQGYLSNEKLLEICNEQYENIVLEEPKKSFIPNNLVNMCSNTNCVPIKHVPSKKELYVLTIPEYTIIEPDIPLYKIIKVPTTLHYFISNYNRVYGHFKELNHITGRLALSMILEQAIKFNIPDLTISNFEESVIVYYNRNKRKVMTNNIFPRYIMDEIIKVITIKSPISDTNENKAKYIGYDIDDEYRARIVINKTYHGNSITIRLFSKESFNKTLNDLRINKKVIDILCNNEYNMNNGIRLIVGETMSGKNTTALAILKRLVDSSIYKIVSIEMPIEQRIDGVEQIDTEFIEEYTSNIESLIHQNPDFIYITEMKDETGYSIMKIANTGKKVLSTLHSNSVSDTISRIQDITNLSMNRIIQVLHTIMYQELVNINDKLYPIVKIVYFDDELKSILYDKSFGEVIRIIKEREIGGLEDGLL